MALPDSGPSALVISGVATSEGYMTLSGDGRLLAIAGYNTESRGVDQFAFVHRFLRRADG